MKALLRIGLSSCSWCIGTGVRVYNEGECGPFFDQCSVCNGFGYTKHQPTTTPPKKDIMIGVTEAFLEAKKRVYGK